MRRPPRHLKVETCVTPTAAVRALRELSIACNWNVRRTEGSRLVDRWAIVVPLAQGAKTIGLVIETGPLAGVAMEAYSHVQGSAGAITISEWLIPNELEEPWRRLFRQWTAIMPRCPWRWTFGERSRIGFLLPVWGRSRKTFRKQGVPVGKEDWPEQNLEEWPPSEWLIDAGEE